MKKIISAVLALVLVFSFELQAFAGYSYNSVVVLTPEDPYDGTAVAYKTLNLGIEQRFYVFNGGTYYIALPDKPYENIHFSAEGPIHVELVEYNPEKITVDGLDIRWALTFGGEKIESGLSYEEAKGKADSCKGSGKNGYDIVPETNVNIIRITVEPNTSDEVKYYNLKIYATLNGVNLMSKHIITCDTPSGNYAALLGVSFRDNDTIPITGAPAPFPG